MHLLLVIAHVAHLVMLAVSSVPAVTATAPTDAAPNVLQQAVRVAIVETASANGSVAFTATPPVERAPVTATSEEQKKGVLSALGDLSAHVWEAGTDLLTDFVSVKVYRE